MIVVFDTNVVISAILSPRGAPAGLFERWMESEFDVATSPVLLIELARALRYEQVRKYTRHTEKDIDNFVEQYGASSVLVEPQITITSISKDPSDNRVLECAMAARASYIITGDIHLLELKEFQGVVILPPAGFLAILSLK